MKHQANKWEYTLRKTEGKASFVAVHMGKDN